MPRPPYRFYYPGKLTGSPGSTIELPEGESHHLRTVLRLDEGSAVSIFDSRGDCWDGVIAARGGKLATVELLRPVESAPTASSRLLMSVSLLKRRAMDWMIEKLSELDVVSLQPLVSRRSVAAAPKSKDLRPPERWERLARAAAKQSGRNMPMSFYPITPLTAWLQRERPRVLSCFAHNGPGAVGLGDWLGDRAGMNLPVLVAVGPEGGWTPGEVEAFKRAGFTAVNLGPLVLRAETAAVTVAAACRVML